MDSKLTYIKVDEEHKDQRLDVFLTESLPEVPSRSLIKKLIDNGHVKVNEENTKAKYKVQVGDDVGVQIPDDFLTKKYIEPENIPLDVFYEDDHIMIINKQTGLTVHPASGSYSGTLVNALLYHTKKLSNLNSNVRPGIVHRLDKDTSGLMIIAKDNIAHTKLAKQFKRHEVKKHYVALVQGVIDRDEGLIEVPITKHPRYHDKRAVGYDDFSKDASTRFRVLKRYNKKSLVALFPKTGRTHQLRVHMQHLGYPILGDKKYGRALSFERLALHAQMVGFIHPSNGGYVEFTSRIPDVFLRAMEK
ncbi:MAG: 23S rRNA pseudouridine1911/1915/1917 synthase [Lysobacterales bacterium]|jgi:23S rRNA pseudouridine1911/1915/1917 synthase